MQRKQKKALLHAVRRAIASGKISISVQETTLTAPENSPKTPNQRGLSAVIRSAWKPIVAVGTLVGLLAVFDYWPSVSVESISGIRGYLPPGSYMAGEVGSAPASSTFKITNTSKYPLQKVWSSCFNPVAKFSQDDTTQVATYRDQSGRVNDPEDITAGETPVFGNLDRGSYAPIQCTLQSRIYTLDPLHRTVPPTWAEVIIAVKFQVAWVIPIRRRFWFVTENNPDGSVQWVSEAK